MTKDELKILLPQLERRIPFDEDFWTDEDEYEASLTQLLEDSRDILLNKLYPFENYSSYTIPAHKYNWVLRCCIELRNLADKAGVTSYSENGLSWTRFSDGLSKSLTNELVSHVGIPKKITIDNAETGEDDE